jgi:UDP-N-acetylglucosamine 2-epimerase (non-hydrolysing)
MDKKFFSDLKLPQPDYNLEVGSGSHGNQTAKIMMGIEQIFIKKPTDIALVQGDTNTVLGGAISASKLHIPVGHVEAGLRSHDRNMPEEINRILTDHIADFLFCPTDFAKRNLILEGVEKERIFITGNTIVDAIFQNKIIANTESNVIEYLGLEKKKYLLITLHRAENVDSEKNLKGIIESLERIAEFFDLVIIFPVHPRTKKMLNIFNIPVKRVKIIEPVGFIDFIMLEANARVILTDSGGVQEEACILRIPCVTLRHNTERPETVEVGANVLAGNDPDSILENVDHSLKRNNNWDSPFGDGESGKKIIDILLKNNCF